MMRLKGSIVMLYLILVPLPLNSNVLFNLESVQCIYYIIKIYSNTSRSK